MTGAGADDIDPARGKPLSMVLFELAYSTDRERIYVRDLLQALGDRALGALMFVFAVPNVIPVPPGVSAILGTPLIFLAAQLMLGHSPWLPELITRRSLQRTDFAALTRRIIPWLSKAERLLRPRMTMLAAPPMEYVAGLICLLLAVILVLPVPLGNTLPALAISVLALGVLERDGYWILAGLALAALAATVVSGVVLAMIQAAMFVIERVIQ